MPNKGLTIVSVLKDRVNYAIDEGTMGTVEFKDIKSMDFAWIQFDNIIRLFQHDNSVLMLDNGSRPGHGLGGKYQSWLNANGLSGFGEKI